MSLTPHYERFADVVAEAAVLSAKHWIELYGAKEFRADFGGMVQLEKQGGMAYFTLRTDSGVLAGYFCAMVFRSPFYGMLMAVDIAYYILPEYRGTFGMCKLLRFAAETLRKQGVERIVVSQRAGDNLGAILKRSGFERSGDTYFFKE